MKGLTLCGVSALAIFVFSSVALRFYRGNREYRVLLAAFAFSAILYAGLHAFSGPDLGFLPPGVLEPNRVMDFANGLAILAMLFHGFWVFTYVATLGPSVRLMIEVHRRGPEGTSGEDLLSTYGESESANALMQRRFPKLVEGRWIFEEGGVYRMRFKGRAIARLCSVLRKLINRMPEP